MRPTVPPYLFAYGTLRRRPAEPAHKLLAGHATFVGMGSFRAKLYDLGRYPGAVASKKRTDRVYGELYRLGQTAPALLKHLDRYEGKLFKRRLAQVSLASGRKLVAWVYLYSGALKENRQIGSGDYLAFRGTL